MKILTKSAEDPRIPDLINAILRAASGDFETTLLPTQQRDDIDAVIVGFNAMASRLSEMYNGLDELVAQRTELLQSAQSQLEALAYQDTLTGLGNRAELDRQLDSRLNSISRGEPESTLFMLDLDSFKLINDTHGHDVGDQVLQEIAKRLQEGVRDQDVVARLGGDEFAVLAQLADKDADLLAQRLLARLNKQFVSGSVAINPGVSIGYSRANSSGSASEWMHRSDTAMYVAKKSSTLKARRFEAQMLKARNAKSQLIIDLRTAVHTDQIYAVYQPIIDLRSGEVTGVEALARWNHPLHGFLPAGRFIDLAFESGLLPVIRTRMLHQGLKDLKSWQDAGIVSGTCLMHININPQDLHDASLVNQIKTELALFDIDPKNLVLEITEDLFITEDQSDHQTLVDLQDLGVKVYIDDFGAGYSSFGYLIRLPVTGIKIDRSITALVEQDPKQFAVMQALVQLTSACGLDCVVEGVESEEQINVLRQLGVEYAQGFHIAKPGTFPITPK